METRSKRRRLLQSYIPPLRPDLPAIFESLNDDTLGLILQFIGNKSYRSFGVNKRCKEVYFTTKGMTKETFLFGYGPLSVIRDRCERVTNYCIDRVLLEAVGKGVVLYNRRDVMDWALEERKKYVLRGICTIASKEERFDLLNKVWNNVNGEDNKEYVFGFVDYSAARHGKLNVLKWFETRGSSIDKFHCAKKAARHGQLHILKWLHEEKGWKVNEGLYNEAVRGGNHLHVVKWLHEQGCPWHEYTFQDAAENVGNLDILQWLHDAGYPWSENLRHRVYIHRLQPGVIDWLRVNGYGGRILVPRVHW